MEPTPRSISISEIGQFMRCRRQWDLNSPWRQNLVKIGVPSAALFVGSGFHDALEANANREDWREAVSTWVEGELATFIEYYTAQVGTAPSEVELAPFGEAEELVINLMERYFARYSETQPLGPKYEYVCAEQTCAVPIPGTDGIFTFTMDGIARDVETGQLWIVEHKTYSSKPDMDRLSTDHQMTAYAWAVSAILGQPITGILYDGMSKKIPGEPALLKSGRLSEQFTETIDGMSYRRAIARHGLDEDDYVEILARYDERDAQPQTPFFTRWKIVVLQSQIDAFASYVNLIYNDMVNAPAIYPNFRFDGCWDCGVRDLCKSMQLGDDVEWIKQTYYMSGRGSQSFQRKGGKPVTVDAASLVAAISA